MRSVFFVCPTLWGMKRESYHRKRRCSYAGGPLKLSGTKNVCWDERAAPAASLRLEASYYGCAASPDAITLCTDVSSPPLLLVHACSLLRQRWSLGAHTGQKCGTGLRLPGFTTARKRRLSTFTRVHWDTHSNSRQGHLLQLFRLRT